MKLPVIWYSREVINVNELLFVVDENNIPLGPLPRHIVHEKGLWHRTTGIWVVSPEKDVLCQKRSLKKDIEPGKMEAFFGGHVNTGQSDLDNAVKEVAEELGIKTDKESFKYLGIFKSEKPTHREFQAIFALTVPRNETFHAEADEITSLEWHSLEEVKKMLLEENNPEWVHKSWNKQVLDWIEHVPSQR